MIQAQREAILAITDPRFARTTAWVVLEWDPHSESWELPTSQDIYLSRDVAVAEAQALVDGWATEVASTRARADSATDRTERFNLHAQADALETRGTNLHLFIQERAPLRLALPGLMTLVRHPRRSRPVRSSSIFEDQRFDEALNHLMAFREEFGHGQIHRAYRTATGYRLGAWASAMRSHKEKGTLPPARERSLAAAGFGWYPPRFSPENERRFQQGLERLPQFQAEFGHGWVPTKWVTTDGFALGAWAQQQRSAHRHGTLDAKRRLALDAAGFTWTRPRIERLPSTGWTARREELFAQGVAHLREYVAANGTGWVPQLHRSPDGYPLGSWTSRVRAMWRHGSLEPERVAAVEDAGMAWTRPKADRTQRTGPDRAERKRQRFELGVAHLREYVAANGTGWVPRSYRSPDGYPLGTWAATVRALHRNSDLSPDEIRALEDAEVMWRRPTRAKTPRAKKERSKPTFTAYVTRLTEYRAVFGHAITPQSYCSPDGAALGRWVARMRQARKHDRLSPTEIALLDAAGMVWEDVAIARAATVKSGPTNRKARFARNVQRLKAYQKEFGHCRVPQSYKTKDGYAFGQWVSRMRIKHRAGTLTHTQKQALERAGFLWEP